MWQPGTIATDYRYAPPALNFSAYREKGSVKVVGTAHDDKNLLRGQRILIVEDEVLVAMDMAYSLEEYGAEIIGPVHSLDDALTIVGEEYVQAAVLDVDLFGVESYPVAHKLQSQNVPFLFNTGHASRHEISDLFGAVPVCVKPTDSETLAGVLHVMLKAPN